MCEFNWNWNQDGENDWMIILNCIFLHVTETSHDEGCDDGT